VGFLFARIDSYNVSKMTTTATGAEPKKAKKDFDPESYRMTIGEHLEELRTRLILGLSGFVIAAIVFLIPSVAVHVARIFIKPLVWSLRHAHQSPQLYYSEVTESFMVYIKIGLICAAAVSSPWLLYQLWKFVAAGLYPRERKYITKYLPLSIFLLISGMLFLYFVVLPLMMTFFLEFNLGQGDMIGPARIDPAASTQPAFVVPSYNGDPEHPVERQLWFDRSQFRLKFYIDDQIGGVPFVSSGLATPLITLRTYIDMVVMMLLSFGVAFQMPLVVLALVRIGIFTVPQLKKMRRVVYFACAVIAAFIVPDVVTGMLALMFPLVLLFELGLWLAREPKARVP
jgi:sec-independent protein translocase protein TatC